MLKQMLGAIFRRTPAPLRRLHSRFLNDQFSVTAGAIVLDRDGRLLLLKHVFRPGSGWGIPGGFIKAGEQPEEAVRRELREEVAVQLDDLEVAFVRTLKRMQQVEVIFNCRSDSNPVPQSVEIERAEWFQLDALPATLSRDQHQLIERALARREKDKS